MRAGEHVGKMRVNVEKHMWVGILLSVAEKPGLTANVDNNWKQVHGWGSIGYKTILGKKYGNDLQTWEGNVFSSISLELHLSHLDHHQHQVKRNGHDFRSSAD